MVNKNETVKQEEKVITQEVREDIKKEKSELKEEVKQKQNMEEIKQEIKTQLQKKKKKCARCGAEIVDGKTECVCCLAPISWKR